ncbi:MAG: hypothetical protein E6J20_11025 [Chloroflexi bacterium]|nr:MAG: hypothetical protein E6J20_11025 [Chloroflexota bacterium]
MKSTPVAYGLLLVGLLCVVAAILYAVGILQLFASTSSGPHYKHAILFGVLAVACFIAFNFARPKTV